MMTPLVFAWLSLGMAIFALAVGVLWLVRRGGRLSGRDRAAIRTAWADAMAVADPQRQVLEAEKAFVVLLRRWGRFGGFAETFTPVAWRFPNAQDVWSAHRLRNRIAHESGLTVRPAEAKRAVAAFKVAIHRYVSLS